MPKGTANVTRKTARAVVAGKRAERPASSEKAGAKVVAGVTTASVAAPGAPTPNLEQVAARAYAIYLAEGRPEGRDKEHWLRAEAELGVAH